jgi:hypothetical protein
MSSVWNNYRHAETLEGRIIVENGCLILQIFQMGEQGARLRHIVNTKASLAPHQCAIYNDCEKPPEQR